MSRVEEVARGLVLLAHYSPHIAAEHDIIYAGNDKVRKKDASVLESLGWFYAEEYACWAVFT